MNGLMYLVIGGGEWAKHHGFYQAVADWEAKKPLLDHLPFVYLAHPNTLVDKDGDIRFHRGQKVQLIGALDIYRRLVPCS